VVIAHGVSCRNTAAAFGDPCIKEHAFGKGGLTTAGMSEQGDIFYVV
jgi:hypothetical protein